MIKRGSQTLKVWFFVWDLLTVGACWVGAYYLYFLSGWFNLTKDVPDESLCWMNLPLIVLTAMVGFRMGGMYEVHRLRRFREELAALIRGTALTVLLMMATIFFRQDPYESRGAMTLFAGSTFILIMAVRRFTWQSVRWLRKRGFNPSYALIVGTGRTARRTARALRHASWLGIRNVGYIEDKPSKWSKDLVVLGGTQDLPEIIQRYRIDHIFISLPLNRYHEARLVFESVSEQFVEVRLVADMPALAGVTLTTTSLEGMTVIGLRENPHFGANILIKRAMDIVLASIAFVILSPILLLISILVKLTSHGPILFRQERCSLNGEKFTMLKFRSMRTDAESASGPVFAQKGDPRKTRLGNFLRKTSLDELPQIINVLRGDMSLVGPRPERPEFISQFTKTIPNYMARHSVKCGITGWAQVNGWRGNTSLRKRIQYDLYYITHWNPWFDIRIMWLTIWKGIIHRNAY
jgi:Undecaprenyl-phosphate glucose phosphotransferase